METKKYFRVGHVVILGCVVDYVNNRYIRIVCGVCFKPNFLYKEHSNEWTEIIMNDKNDYIWAHNILVNNNIDHVIIMSYDE